MYSLGSVSSLVSEKKIFEISANQSILLALATNELTEPKLYMNDHWNVLYQVTVFYVDRKSKMAAIAGHRLTLDPISHIEYPTRTKNSNFVEDHPRNIPAKFGSNRPSGFGEEA
jgi:hypothetical protein